MLLVVVVLMRDRSPQPNPTNARASTPHLGTLDAALVEQPELGQRHQFTYQQWIAVLEQEAAAAIENPPERLDILAGDSLSLWFPSDLLPADRSWLNQGISGEISAGLLSRLSRRLEYRMLLQVLSLEIVFTTLFLRWSFSPSPLWERGFCWQTNNRLAPSTNLPMAPRSF